MFPNNVCFQCAFTLRVNCTPLCNFAILPSLHFVQSKFVIRGVTPRRWAPPGWLEQPLQGRLDEFLARSTTLHPDQATYQETDAKPMTAQMAKERIEAARKEQEALRAELSQPKWLSASSRQAAAPRSVSSSRPPAAESPAVVPQKRPVSVSCLSCQQKCALLPPANIFAPRSARPLSSGPNRPL